MNCTACGTELSEEAHRLQVDSRKVPAMVSLAFPVVGRVLPRVRLYRCPAGCGITGHFPDELDLLLPRRS